MHVPCKVLGRELEGKSNASKQNSSLGDECEATVGFEAWGPTARGRQRFSQGSLFEPECSGLMLSDVIDVGR